jgi:putative hydrolase of the HAD superfamily
MTIKAIMVDVDGVLVTHPDPSGWHVHLKRDLGLSPDDLQQHFFAYHWDDVVHGRAGLRERLSLVLAKLTPQIEPDRLIRYWFANDAHVNKPLLRELISLRCQGLATHLATVQEHERAQYLWETLDLREYFDGMHYAAALGCSKPDATFFRAIETRTGFKPSEIFFIDDKLANIEAAWAAGWRAALWTGDSSLQTLLASSPT